MSGEEISGSHVATNDDSLRLGNVVLDLRSFRLSVEGALVDVTYHEFELLALLAAQPDHVLSYTALAIGLWGSAGRKELRHLNVVVHKLRRKMEASFPYVIETVRGRGYGLLRSRSRSERPRCPAESRAASLRFTGKSVLR